MSTDLEGPDATFMREAIREARKAIGMTRPNPPVGAVIVKRGDVIGRGFHPAAGKPHAEIHALRQAGAAAKGSTLYVSLEPCSTQGRTPPCTDAIINSGIKRVVYACVDPNPKHAGRADAILRKAGIGVTRRFLEAEAEDILRPFKMRMLKKRPFVTLKLACTMDGRIADARGHSRWITGPKSRAAVQALRRSADAIMVGAGTLRADNPSLLPRPAKGRDPFRIIVAGSGKLPPRSKVFLDERHAKTIVACSRIAPLRSHLALRRRGVHMLACGQKGGRLDLAAMMHKLADMNIMHVVCEGGGVLAGSLLDAGLVDEIWMFYASKVLGSSGKSAFYGSWSLDEAPGFEIKSITRSGGDVLMIGIPSKRRGI